MNPLYFLRLIASFFLFDLRLAAGNVHYPEDELIRVSRLGHTFKASRRTVQHLDWTVKRLRRRYPWARLTIIQTCYHTGVDLSAGTHDKDCAFDFRIVGLGWWLSQRFLRNAGWGCWFRHTGEWDAKGAWHVHAISLPPGLAGRDVTADQVGAAFHKIGLVVGEFIDGGRTTKGSTIATSQVRDYFHRTFGLANEHDNGEDHSWFPPNIAKTIYTYNPKVAA